MRVPTWLRRAPAPIVVDTPSPDPDALERALELQAAVARGSEAWRTTRATIIAIRDTHRPYLAHNPYAADGAKEQRCTLCVTSRYPCKTWLGLDALVVD